MEWRDQRKRLIRHVSPAGRYLYGIWIRSISKWVIVAVAVGGYLISLTPHFMYYSLVIINNLVAHPFTYKLSFKFFER